MTMGLLSIRVVLFAVVMVFYGLQATAIGPNLIKVEGAVAKGAVCLDGSPPAYQLDWGENEGANSWLIHLEGGSWCNKALPCQYRINHSDGLGSSANMKRTEFTGILNFYNWNRVYVRYCDGSSFTGDKHERDPKYGLYYRGGRIFYAIMDELLKLGMNSASGAILSGCSAGGLAAILHCDKFFDLLPSTTNVKCLSDAGYFIHLKDVFGNNTFEMFFAEIVQLHGSAKHLPPSCTSKMNATLCFFPQNIVADISTPIFLLNSAFDSWQIGNILVPQNISRADNSWRICKYDIRYCSVDKAEKWDYFRLKFLQAVIDLGISSSRGLFINSCHTHCQSQFQGKWFGDSDSMLDNKTIADAVGEWYNDRRPIKFVDYVHSSPQQCVVDHTEPYACNNYSWGNSYRCNRL